MTDHWSPDQYNKFCDQRMEPFGDLIALVRRVRKMRIVDLGCGTGELTSVLADEFPDATVEGIDSSPAMLERAAPLAGRFVDELSPEEVDALIKLVDEMPQFTEHMVTDIMPILATLDRVGPDLHELLDVTKDLRQAIDGIPGFGFLKKRGASKDDEEE